MTATKTTPKRKAATKKVAKKTPAKKKAVKKTPAKKTSEKDVAKLASKMDGDRTIKLRSSRNTPTSVDNDDYDNDESGFSGVKNIRMWAVDGDAFFPCQTATDKLPEGQYVIHSSPERGVFLYKKSINLDDIIFLPDSPANIAIAQIEKFWAQEKMYRDYGFLHKRGIMMFGDPGTGKTTTVQLLSKLVIERGGVSVYLNHPEIGATGLEILRRIEPDRPIVCMMEDLDAITHKHGEPELLALLDGELQIDNVVFVATTNYPDKLDKRITNRPSRFDHIIKIDYPSAPDRETYLKAKLPKLKGSDLKEWVDATQGMTIAHLKELILSVYCFDKPLDDAVDFLRKWQLRGNPEEY